MVFRVIVVQGKVGGGEFVVIYGCGGVGLFVIMIVYVLGVNVIGIDINFQQLKLVRVLGVVVIIDVIKVKNFVEVIWDYS